MPIPLNPVRNLRRGGSVFFMIPPPQGADIGRPIISPGIELQNIERLEIHARMTAEERRSLVNAALADFLAL